MISQCVYGFSFPLKKGGNGCCKKHMIVGLEDFAEWLRLKQMFHELAWCSRIGTLGFAISEISILKLLRCYNSY